MAFGADDSPTAVSAPPVPVEVTTAEKLNDIEEKLKQKKAERDKLTAELKRAPDGPEKEDLAANLEQLNENIHEREEAFEFLVTGGVESAQPGVQGEKKFDWESNLIEIIQPIMSELRRLTEKKRREQNLRNRIAFHAGQLETSQQVIEAIERINRKELSRKAAKKYGAIQKIWAEKRQEHQHLLEVNRLQLAELKRPRIIKDAPWQEKWNTFSASRMATLILALGAALVVYFLLDLPLRLLRFFLRGRLFAKRSLPARLLVVGYHFMTVAITVLAMFWVFNERGDRVLEGLFLLLTFALLLSLKNTIPRYVEELKLLLNIGPVREGEWVLVRDILWRVDALDMFARLYNPCMSEPGLRVPLGEMASLHSRKPHENEKWFPCRTDDYVMLADSQYGRIQWISPETVAMRVAGGSIRSYTTGDFLANSPKNLSTGFALAVIFGIDYKHQAECTDKIPQLLTKEIEEGLKQKYGAHVPNVSVEFDEAAASSLNYKIIAQLDGKIASEYFPIQRAIQRLAVEGCNRHGWEIPFTQVTIHQAV
uniref:Mechanosensitive ion channel n=1 Tax=Candidatus Kentrum sp. TC TaxID=2126339 RepID=A0A450ZFU0_9GAMM|nr:MAG: Mechanosensitive ion channel [Candidatus Kentron sp. TC]